MNAHIYPRHLHIIISGYFNFKRLFKNPTSVSSRATTKKCHNPARTRIPSPKSAREINFRFAKNTKSQSTWCRTRICLLKILRYSSPRSSKNRSLLTPSGESSRKVNF